MDKQLITKVRKKILELHSVQGKENRDEIRNNIYLEMKPFMQKTVTSVLHRKGIYISDEETLSIAWDCFEYCMSNYRHKKKIPIPVHFYKYSFFYITNELKKERKINKKHEIISFEDLSTAEIGFDDDAYEELEELKSFRSTLPTNYITVFDDAFMSLSPHNKDKINRMTETSLTNVRYQESKKIFKIIIRFLITR
jgi:hypothetical protein